MRSDVKIVKNTTYKEKWVSQKGFFFPFSIVPNAGGLDPLCLLLRKMYGEWVARSSFWSQILWGEHMWIPRALSLPSVGWAHGPISRCCDVRPSCCIIFTLVLLYPVWECQPFLMLHSPYFVSFYLLNFFGIYSWGSEILSSFLAVIIHLCLIGSLCWVSVQWIY